MPPRRSLKLLDNELCTDQADKEHPVDERALRAAQAWCKEKLHKDCIIQVQEPDES